MSPKEIGASIYEKYSNSEFVSKKQARAWLEQAKKEACEAVRTGGMKKLCKYCQAINVILAQVCHNCGKPI